MGTMLMTRSTPRITYRMGRRAWLETLEDTSLPSLVADAEGEVAAAFKVSLKFYRGMGRVERKGGGAGVTKVPREK